MKDLSGLEVLDYFRILWNRRWYFLVVFALVSIGGTLYVRRKPDVYRSEARITVDTTLSSVARAPSAQERVDIIREQLYSRSFLERMIGQMGMYGYGESNFALDQAVRTVQNNLKVRNTSNRMFTISYSSTDPTVAQNITRQFTQELIRVSSRLTENRTMTVDRFVEQKFTEAEKKLSEHGEKIREFRLNHAGKLPEQTVNTISGLRTQLNDVERAILQARDNKESLEYRYNERKRINDQYAQILSSSGQKPKVPRGATPEEHEIARKMESLSKYEANLAQALIKYTENHPDVRMFKGEISRLEQEIEEARANLPFIPFEIVMDEFNEPQFLTKSDIQEEQTEKEHLRQISAVEANIAKREEERERLQKRLDEYESQLKISPKLEQELNALRREEALLEKEYQNFADQKFKAGLATAVETDKENEVYRIIDEANFPFYPTTSKLQLFLMSIGGGFILGIVVAYGREFLDSTIGSEEEAKKVLHLPVLAAIPVAPKKNKKTELRKTA